MNNALAQSAPSPSSKRSKPKGDDENRGEISRISVNFTENGCGTCVSFDPDKIDPKQDRYSQMPEDEDLSWNDLAKAKAYVNKMMDQHKGWEDSEAPADKKAPAKKEDKAA
jgi:hypothetical protein